MAQLPTDAVKATAAKVVTSGVTRVVTTLVDPAAAVRRAAADIKDLPRQAVGLPVRLALGGLVLFEKVRTALPGQGSAETPEDAPTPVKAAPTPPPPAAPAPPATPPPATPPPATPPAATPLHEGRDGHRDIDLPAAAEAAVEAAPSGADLGSADLPLAGFDGLSLAQIRGRLAKLDVVQLAQLRDYERAHADRTPVVTMLENRLAKVGAGGGSPA